MNVRNEFTLSSWVTRLSLTTIVAGLVYAAIPSERQIAMQTAQLKRPKMLEDVAKACTPSRPTMHYGLLISGGQLLKFDAAGDFKAKEAVDISPVEPGKTVKVKVTGIVEAEDTSRVASIELKGRIPPPRASSGR
jgi:hypothetical protein